jgi:hypothetical protein
LGVRGVPLLEDRSEHGEVGVIGGGAADFVFSVAGHGDDPVASCGFRVAR